MIPSFLKTTLSPVFRQLQANERRLTVDFHGSFLKMVWLHTSIFGISDESTETSCVGCGT